MKLHPVDAHFLKGGTEPRATITEFHVLPSKDSQEKHRCIS